MTTLSQELHGIYRYRYVIYSFVSTNLRQRYRRSTLGFLWTVFAPLLQYVIIAFVFKYAAKITDETYFSYFFSGAVVFNAFTTTLLRGPVIMLANELYIKKIYLPKSVFVLSSCFYEMTNFLFSSMTLLLLGACTGYIQPSSSLVSIPIGLILILMTLLGLSGILSVGGVYFRDLSYILPPVMQASFFVTPIVYKISDIPLKFQNILTLNPFYHFIEIIRTPLISKSFASADHFLFAGIFSIITLWAGQWFIRKFDNRIIFKL